MNKKEFRKQMTQVRAGISEEVKIEAPKECMKLLRAFLPYQQTDLVYIFVAFGDEINTKEMISEILRDGKRVAVPKVVGKEMIFREIRSLEDCEAGTWGILEPKDERPVIEETGIMLMPGLGFDEAGHRLGYGGGFYDKYLAAHPDLLRIGLAYEEQVVESVPCEEHDIIVKCLLTPSKIRKIC